MSFQNKYLKYKNKYLDLKNQIGGSKAGNEMSDIDIDIDNLFQLIEKKNNEKAALLREERKRLLKYQRDNEDIEDAEINMLNNMKADRERAIKDARGKSDDFSMLNMMKEEIEKKERDLRDAREARARIEIGMHNNFSNVLENKEKELADLNKHLLMLLM